MSNSLIQIEMAPSNAYVFNNAMFTDSVMYTTTESQRLLFGTKSNVNAGLMISSSNISLTLQPATSNNAISFYGGNSNLLTTILANGNVGIGKTYPVFPLDVIGSINLTGGIFQNGAAYVGSQWMNTGSNLYILGSNVGIGTTTPAQALHVTGNLQVDSNLYLANTINFQGVSIKMKNGDGVANMSTVVTSVPGYAWNSNVVLSSGNSNYYVSTKIGSNEIMRVNGNGNVGIGTTAPTNKLHVYATGASTYVTIQGDTTQQQGLSWVDGGVSRWTQYRPISATDMRWNYTPSGADVMSLSSTGGLITIGDMTCFGSISDVRYKENVLSLTNSMDVISRLRPVEFTWKNDIQNESYRGKHDYGFIAQEVEAVIPEATKDVEINGDAFKTIKYERVVPFLLGAIQELSGNVSRLEADITAKDERIKQLETDLLAVKAFVGMQ